MTTDTTQTISGRKTFTNGLANDVTQDGRLSSLPPIALTDISQLNAMSIGAQIFVNRALSLQSLVPPAVTGDFFCIKCTHKSNISTNNGIFEASQQGLASAKFYGTLSVTGVITWSRALVDGVNAIADANGSWIVPGSAGSVSINDLTGIPLPFPAAVAPTGWLKCNGQSFDKTLYPILASRYPSGVLPDLRGEFVRGWDDGRGADSGRALLSAQSDAIRNITGKFETADRQNYVPSGAFADVTRTGAGISGSFVGVYHTEIDFDASKVVPTANENRPRNIAFNYIVRAA
ncbi:hypothetical protein F9U45_05370 [Pectobacterium versatile]|nr:hypothetical protein [Pectobacterium versatile]